MQLAGDLTGTADSTIATTNYSTKIKDGEIV
jgi:hypothetical protein